MIQKYQDQSVNTLFSCVETRLSHWRQRYIAFASSGDSWVFLCYLLDTVLHILCFGNSGT